MEIQLEGGTVGSGKARYFFGITILLVLMAIGADIWDRKQVNNLRALSIEEQETVFAAIDRTAIQHRLSKGRVRELRSRIHDTTYPIFVDHGLGASPLLKMESQVVLFSPKFFEADPISQENSILRITPISPNSRN